ncbi:hypothetical protein [Spiroplasma sp. DGKH1]|uniref:hypothetical protein n=1 Tax=Spiroplasma sp. DGKH1 TaxID=3050074 RepID=UPI0034C67ADB
MTQISNEVDDLTVTFSSLQNLMEDRKQAMTRIIGLDKEFQELYFKLYVVMKQTGSNVQTLLHYRKDVHKCNEIIQEIRELQRQQRLHHKIFEVLHSNKLTENPLHPPIIFENKEQTNLLQESIEPRKEENFKIITELLGESSSVSSDPLNLDSFIFNFRDCKEDDEKIDIDDILNMEKPSEANCSPAIADLENRSKKLLEQKEEHCQKEETLTKLKNLKLAQLDGAR